MKIKSLKINGFGKLKDKDIELKNGINIIYGKNEAGKSTILKFIIGMFYGLSKNKNGQLISDIEKYEPWENEIFSGKIKYDLDNNKAYEVYRDFKKKNPNIFNESLEDISKEFNIDKTKGNQFFYDQIGLEEEIFTSSIITKQSEVKLDNKTQNNLIQKISNILGTGEDKTSYTTIVTKLKKKINDEIGTANTKEKPINIIESKLKKLDLEKEELKQYQSYKFDIEENINKISEGIEKEKIELNQLRKANVNKEKLKEEENKIKINQDIVNNLDEDINKLLDEKSQYKNINKSNISKINYIIIFAITVATILVEILKFNILTKIIIPLVLVSYVVYLIIKYTKQKKEYKVTRKKYKEIEEKIKILNQSKEKQKKDLKILNEEYRNNILNIKKENNINNLENIIEQIDEKQDAINRKTLNLHTLELDKNNVIPKLEKLVNIEEKIENLKEEKEHLDKKKEILKRTLEYLEISYYKMKEQITPKFTNELSKAIKKISNGKYKNVRINTNGELIVEENTGNYINAENLSIGTIDQLYLSLRLAIIKDITKENMPIILDEAFAYYDDNRLENIITYLSEEYSNKQIIIFTCTKREKSIIEKLQINYNYIQV